MIIEKFREIFTKYSFKEIEGVNIFPSPDNSTFFTCATISLFKGNILTDLKIESEFVVQPCLRTQNLNNQLDSNFFPEYMSYFNMLGNICSIDRLNIQAIVDFFSTFPSLKDRLVVKIHPSMKFMAGFNLLEKDFELMEVEFDYFCKWSYGDKRLTGLGVTFSILQNNNVYADIGNLVRLDLMNKPVAWEFGLGYETFKSRLFNLDNPFLSSPYFKHFSSFFNKDISAKILDLMVSGNEMFLSGVKPEFKNEFKILNKTLRFACFMIHSNNTSKEIFSNIINIFQDIEYKDLLMEYYLNTQKMILKFQMEVKNARNVFTDIRLEKKINEYAVRNTIPKDLVTCFA